MLRALPLSLLCCLFVSVPASAQIPVAQGRLLEFFHGVDQFVLSQKYQLCVDLVSDAACPDIVPAVSPSAVAGWYSFPLPATIAPGPHYIGVRAVGFGTGPTAVSNALWILVTAPPVPGLPSTPTGLRVVP